MFDSLKQAEAHTHIPKRILQALNDAGVAGFEHGRIHLKTVLPAAMDMLLGDGGELEKKGGPAIERLYAAKASREELKLAHDHNKLVDRTLVESAVFKCVMAMDRAWDYWAKVTGPKPLEGLLALNISAKLVAEKEKIIEKMKADIATLGQKEEKS